MSNYFEGGWDDNGEVDDDAFPPIGMESGDISPRPSPRDPERRKRIQMALFALAAGIFCAGFAWFFGQPLSIAAALGVAGLIVTLLAVPLASAVSRRLSTFGGCLMAIVVAFGTAASLLVPPYLYLDWLSQADPPQLLPTPDEMLHRGKNPLEAVASTDVSQISDELSGLGPGEVWTLFVAQLGADRLASDTLDDLWPPEKRHLSPPAMWGALMNQASPFNHCVGQIYPEVYARVLSELLFKEACAGKQCVEVLSDATLAVCLAHGAEPMVNLSYFEAAVEAELKERWRLAPRESLWPEPDQVGACWVTPFELVVGQRGLLRGAWDRLPPWKQELVVGWSRGLPKAELAKLAGVDESEVAAAAVDALETLNASLSSLSCRSRP